MAGVQPEQAGLMQGAISPENQGKLERFDQFTGRKHTSMQRMMLLLQASALFLQIMDQALASVPCDKPADCPAFVQAMNTAGKETLTQIEELVRTALPPDPAGYHESFLDMLQSLIWDSGQLASIAGGRMSLLISMQKSITTVLAQK